MKRARLLALVLGAVSLAGLGFWLYQRSGPEPVRAAQLEALDPEVRARLEEEFAGAARWRRSPEKRLRLGMAYEANALYGEAARTYEQVLELRPGDAKATYRLACAQERMGDLALAADTLARATLADPTYPVSWWRLAAWRLELGETDGAATALARAQVLAPDDPSVQLVEVRLALAHRAPEEAVALLERHGLLKGAQAPYAQHLLALALRQQGDLEGAQRAAAQASGEPPRFADPWTLEMKQFETGFSALRLRAGREVQARRFAEAEQILRRILASDPDDAESRNNLGVCRLEQGDALGALAEIERALALDPGQFEAAVNHGRALVAGGKATPAQLETSYQRLADGLRTRPLEGGAWRVLAALARARGNAGDCLAALDRALELDPAATDLRVTAGYAALESGDVEGALQRFRALQRERPQEAEGWFGEATSLARAQRLDEARAVLGILERRSGVNPQRLERLRSVLK